MPVAESPEMQRKKLSSPCFGANFSAMPRPPSRPSLLLNPGLRVLSHAPRSAFRNFSRYSRQSAIRSAFAARAPVTLRRLRSPSAHRRAFTLIELMVVIGIIALALAVLVPALGPSTGRSLEGAARQLTADLENARQIAIAERTKTRVLIPDKNAPAFGADLALRSYAIVSLNKTAGTWKQRGKWTRLALPATFDPAPAVTPGTEIDVVGDRKTTVTDIDNSATGTGATNSFTGAYVEFRSNGSTSLDPISPVEVLVLADGIPDGLGGMSKKNGNLQSPTLDRSANWERGFEIT